MAVLNILNQERPWSKSFLKNPLRNQAEMVNLNKTKLKQKINKNLTPYLTYQTLLILAMKVMRIHSWMTHISTL